MMLQPATVYERVRAPSEETTIADVLIGAVAIVLGLAAVAVVLGIACAGIMIVFRRFRGGAGTSPGGARATRLGLDASGSSAAPTRPKS